MRRVESDLEEMQSVYQREVHVHKPRRARVTVLCIFVVWPTVFIFLMYNGIVLFCSAYTKQEKS